MIEANTSYKQNGVPVSIPSGSYGIAPLTVHQYEYPKGHPCHNCPYTLRTSVPSCMFPERRDGGCLWYDLKNSSALRCLRFTPKSGGGRAHFCFR